MASNDMNSWDEDPDKLLRRRWQRVFADFEVQPRSSLSRRILDQLPAGRRPTRWLVGAGLFLLLSAGFLYTVRLGEHPESGHGNATTVQRVTPSRPLPASGIRQPAAPIGQSTPRGLPMNAPPVDRSVATRQPSVHPPTAPGVEAYGVEASAGRPTPTGQLPAGQARLRPGTEMKLRATPVPANQRLSESARAVGTRFPVGSSTPVGTGGDERVLTPVERSVSNNRGSLPDPQVSVSQPPDNALLVAWTLLKPLGVTPLPNSLSALPGQLPAIDLVPVYPVEAVVARRSLRWFVEAVPLSSFQRMSVSPTATAYLSPVSAPAAFSPTTWGYQVNGGIRFQRWQAYLSMGQLRRWAYYTVHENRYRVEPSPTNPHHLVRETYAVTENVALPMIGAGLSQQIFAQGRYAVELGGQVSYLPTGDQALMSLRGGAGRRLPLSRSTELQVGVTIEYGLNRLLNTHQHLIIHPLLVGIGFRIQPRSPAPTGRSVSPGKTRLPSR